MPHCTTLAAIVLGLAVQHGWPRNPLSDRRAPRFRHVMRMRHPHDTMYIRSALVQVVDCSDSLRLHEAAHCGFVHIGIVQSTVYDVKPLSVTRVLI